MSNKKKLFGELLKQVKNPSSENISFSNNNPPIRKVTNLKQISNPNYEQNSPEDEDYYLKKHNVLTFAQLLAMPEKEKNWIIPDLLSEGLTILAGSPKVGKSRLVLPLAIDIAMGLKVFDKLDSNKCKVLYMPFEETPEILKHRFDINLSNRSISTDQYIPLNFKFPDKIDIDDYQIFDEKYFFASLQGILDESDIKLVIIDPLGRLNNSSKLLGSTSFINDYNFLGALQSFAISNNIGLIVVHHTRKTPSANTMDSILGTRGVTAAADTIMVLKDKTNGKSILSVSGRYIEEKEFELCFNKDTLEWELTDTYVINVKLTPERKKILDLFLQNPNTELRSSDIANVFKVSQSNISQILRKMVAEGIISKGSRYGFYTLRSDYKNNK